MAALVHDSLPAAARAELRRRILNAEIAAGSRLVETTLAADLGVSRATLREAIRDLANEGLVEVVPRRYSVVTRMSAEDARDVCHARAALEVAAVRATPRPRREVLATSLERALRDLGAAGRSGDIARVVELDTVFHGILVDASGLRRLRELWEAMNSQMGALIRGSIDRQHMDLGELRSRHVPVRDAVIGGTARQAERAIYEHYVDNAPLWTDELVED